MTDSEALIELSRTDPRNHERIMSEAKERAYWMNEVWPEIEGDAELLMAVDRKKLTP